MFSNITKSFLNITIARTGINESKFGIAIPGKNFPLTVYWDVKLLNERTERRVITFLLLSFLHIRMELCQILL